jgi:hypothetical protein
MFLLRKCVIAGGLLSLAKAASWSVVRQAATLRHACVVSRDAIFCDSSFSPLLLFPWIFCHLCLTVPLKDIVILYCYESLWSAAYSVIIPMSCLVISSYLYILRCGYFKSSDVDPKRSLWNVSQPKFTTKKNLYIKKKILKGLDDSV